MCSTFPRKKRHHFICSTPLAIHRHLPDLISQSSKQRGRRPPLFLSHQYRPLPTCIGKSCVTLTELIGHRFVSQRILEGLVCVCFTFVDEDLATAALTLFLLTISDNDLAAAT